MTYSTNGQGRYDQTKEIGFQMKIGYNVIQDFCREICFDNVNQEMQRRFFDNFNKILKYTK
jgi:hypothetical protein